MNDIERVISYYNKENIKKLCKKCLYEKNIDNFNKYSRRCKQCENERYDEEIYKYYIRFNESLYY